MHLKLLISFLGLLLLCQCARADATYSYVGDYFGLCEGTLSSPENPFRCGGFYNVTGSFTTSLDPFHLENLNDFLLPAEDITSFSFTANGTGIMLDQSNSAGHFEISTDAFGRIGRSDGKNSWIASARNPDVLILSAQQGGDYIQIGDGPSGYGQTSRADPGIWSDAMSLSTDPLADRAPVPTPEPGTLTLFGIGLLGVFTIAVRERRLRSCH